jgi:hypothetical protein
MFNLFAMFELDHHVWMEGYRDARTRKYRIPPFRDSTDVYRFSRQCPDVPAYMAGYCEGRDALMRELDQP